MSTPNSNLTPELAEQQAIMERHALNYGLDFFPTIFELIDADQLNAIAARGGFPVRYPHWRFGMEYESLSKSYNYGLSKIYELVINNNPCYAYLMRSNGLVDQKLVMAHVYGHCDFFKNNFWFSKTNRKMMDEMANHGTRIRRHMDAVGVDKVEEFIDACSSVDDLIDIHSPFIKRRADRERYQFGDQPEEAEESTSRKLPAKGYMDSFINPKKKPSDDERDPDQMSGDPQQSRRRFPEHPEQDVMLFMLEHAPLEGWQADVLTILRDEAYYFAPQGQTKIMNEGWASYWHSTIMTREGLTPGDVVNYCDHHSGTLASSPTKLNPYKVGIELFRDIEDRWNRGAFGKEYEDCDDYQARRHWDKQLGAGREKIFEVRKIHNDLTFIDEFLTLDFVREHKLFRFGYNEDTEYYEIESRAFPRVKQQLLNSLTNMGRPKIVVEDGNYRNRGELYLKHSYTGVELDMNYANDTLRNLQRIWSRPVHIETTLEGRQAVLSFDGVDHEIDWGEEVPDVDQYQEDQ
ncbi:SpoVR family protein [Aeoliella sp. ICT_H6.2]|uniref:SpoVR family protein n=1 Tax=Aeoliella straminimaris TaxID=2954799 RepID=A0A9X2FBL9_9BACT|nr:SpoVR family protein [Aeoliella straminimaris]MCO6046007.1 SpoVR family protein [Aeoliella straminimaris]